MGACSPLQCNLMRFKVLKLQGVDFVRLGRENAIHPDLKGHMIDGEWFELTFSW